MLGLMALLLAGQPANLEQTIRDERSAYNAAISAHDLSAIQSVLAPDYVVLPGLTGTPLSGNALLSLFADAFRDKTFITYVRSPDRIQPSSSSKRIAETGHWAGTWNKPDGLMTVSGIYLAFWIPDGDGWKLINESFVTLGCDGSRECASID
jgi:ketosteroid isomerase-like protein